MEATMTVTVTKPFFDASMFLIDDEPWHLLWDDDSTHALCGVLIEGAIVPGEEVPDEDTCETCITIARGLGLW